MSGSEKGVFEQNLETLHIPPSLREQIKAYSAEGVSMKMESGKLEMTYRGETLYDPEDPVGTAVREVQALAHEKDPDLVVVFGMGAGLHPELIRKRYESSPIIVFDPSLDILATTVTKRPVSADKTTVLATFGHLMEWVDHTMDLTDRKLLVVALPSYRRIFPEEYERFKDTLAQTLENMNIRFNTQSKFTEEWTRHMAVNLPALSRVHSFEALGKRFAGRPGFFVGTGPSLDKNIDLLKKAQNKSVIVACNSSIRPLCSAGIIPDLAAIIEGADLEHNFTDVEGLSQVTLLPSANTHPSHLGTKVKRILNLVLRPSPMCDWITKAFEGESVIAGGSVACSAFAVLHWLGCDPIVAVGMDLAFTGDRTHAANSDQEDIVVTFNPQTGQMDQHTVGSQETSYKWNRDMVTAWGGEGTVGTHQVLSSYRYWFEGAAQTWAAGRRLINATEGGAAFKDWEEIPLARAIEESCTDQVPAKELIDEAIEEAGEFDTESLLSAVREEIDLNRECLEMAREADKLVRKSLSFIEKGKYQRADDKMAELGDLEIRLRKATKRTRLLNQLVGHLATKLRLDRFEDLHADQVRQTVNSLERSSKLFGVVKKGASDIIRMFDEALEQASS